VIYDHHVAKPILELARREAIVIETGVKTFGAAWKQSHINALLIKHAKRGHHVVRLKSGNVIEPAETDALTDINITFGIVPGISTSATQHNPDEVELA